MENFLEYRTYALTLVLFMASATAQVDVPLDPGPDRGTAGERLGDAARVEHFQDWSVRCEDVQQQGGAGQAEVCEMVQQVSTEETDETVMEVAVAYVPERDLPVALFTVPLGIRIQPGLQLQVNDNEPVRVAVEICGQEGCMASMAFDEDMLAQFRNGTSGTVRIRDPRDQVHELPISMMGFTAALRRLRE